MPRNTLSMADCIKIITLMEQNMSQVHIAILLRVSQGVASRLWRKFQDTPSVADRRREGHSRKATPAQDWYARISARRNPTTSATTLHHELREATWVAVSGQTVRNRFNDMGLYVRRPRKTQWLRSLVHDGLEHMRIGYEINGPEYYSQRKWELAYTLTTALFM